MKPFRWNLAKREQLGRLVEHEPEPPVEPFTEELVDCAAKVLARTKGRRVLFVGRSPESLFDYLSGVLEGSSWASRIGLLNISNRFQSIDAIKGTIPHALSALKEHFEACEASPRAIVSDAEGLSFCDLVASGGTFERIFEFLQQWADESGVAFKSLRSKLGFIGITDRRKNSPNTWRWQQHADWVKQHRIQVANVSIPLPLWDYLGNRQEKAARGNPPKKWASDEILLPPREEQHIRGLCEAYSLYKLGIAERRDFSANLASLQEFSESWLRNLALELKR